MPEEPWNEPESLSKPEPLEEPEPLGAPGSVVTQAPAELSEPGAVSVTAISPDALTQPAVRPQPVLLAEEPVPPVAAATIQLDRKHPLAIRWMHWINFPVLFTMIWSGLLIYWNDSNPTQGHAHQVYRVGLGSFTLFRFFPDWFWKALDAPYRVTTGLGYHFFFMWVFGVTGVLYVLFLAISGEWRFLVPDRRSLVEAIQVTLVDLHLRKGLPAQRKYNAAQRIAYTAVIVMGAGSLATGLAIYKPAQLHLLTNLLGGYEMARWEHFLLTFGFFGFFLVHVGQVILAGWNNFRSMVSGYEIKPADEAPLEAERRTW